MNTMYDSPKLSPKQKEILKHLANGACYKQVALLMGTRKSTVKNQMYIMKMKLNTDSHIETVIKGLELRSVS